MSLFPSALERCNSLGTGHFNHIKEELFIYFFKKKGFKAQLYIKHTRSRVTGLPGQHDSTGVTGLHRLTKAEMSTAAPGEIGKQKSN